MEELSTHPDITRTILRELEIPVHQNGYVQLCIGLPRFALTPKQSLSKELYPYIAAEFGGVTAGDVEASIRRAVKNGWKHGNPEAWERYFPRQDKAPSNLVFIATLAEYLK